MEARILIIEDNPQVSDALCYLLEKEGHKVNTCSDGYSALKHIEEESYDLIITDLLVPFVSGIEIIKHIRLLKPLQLIFVISSVLENRVIGHLHLLGVTDFLDKPVDALQLYSGIRKHFPAA